VTKKELKILGKQKAEDTLGFIRTLKHVKDPWHGVPFTVLPWEEKIIRDFYGTLKPNGLRQYKLAYVEMTKKQGKSELAAALAIKHLAADGEWSAEVYGCAADKQQASIIFDVAVEMVDQESELKSVIKPILSKKRLVYLPTKSFYQVLSAEAFTKHGLNISACIFDELHAQPNRALWDVMTFGSGDARRQPAWWVITTAGDDPDRQSVCWEQHLKAQNILLGLRNDPTIYPVIFGFDPDEHRIWKGWTYEVDTEVTWESPKVWKAVNPSLDHTIKSETVKEAYNTVKDSPADEKNFKQLRLNIWHRDKVTKWLPLSMWIQCGQLVYPDRLKHRECYGGLDLSTKLDITAYLLFFPPTRDVPLYRILPTFWIPEDNMKERVRRDHVNYDIWEKNGFIKTTPGNYIDYAFIEKHILDSFSEYDIRGIGYDDWNAYETQQRLVAEGVPEKKMVIVRQGYKSLSPPMRDLEAWVKNKMIAHGGNPVMEWMFGNVKAKTDENRNIRYVKDSETERIDGISALVSAIFAYKLFGEQKSVYEERGMRIL